MWRHPAAKPLLALLLAWPACWLLWAAFHDQLGPNPAEALIRQSGDWALRALCVALAVTPLRVITGQVLLMRFRRMLGVNVFVYAALHMLSYAWLDMGLDLEDIARDIAKRPFILVGFLALLVLSALAATSFNKAVRWHGQCQRSCNFTFSVRVALEYRCRYPTHLGQSVTHRCKVTLLSDLGK